MPTFLCVFVAGSTSMNFSDMIGSPVAVEFLPH
jgi:hypothetical protein